MYSSYIKSGILILLAGWLVASCTAVPNPEDDSFECIIISASLDDEDTRTSLAKIGEDNDPDHFYEVRWKTGDMISVNGILSNAVASGDNNKKSVDFTVEGSLSAPYKVLYPGTSSTDVITLPATQNYVANSFDGAAAASFGTATKNGDKYTVRLDHFCGVLRFALNGSATLSKIEINSLGSEKLYGNFTLATDANGFTGSWSGGTAGTLTYSFGSGLTLSGSDTFIYVAIPAQAYASGLEALVYQADGAFMRLKFQVGTTENPKTLGANDIVEFESKTFAAGRTENLLSIANLTAENGGDPTATYGITVAVYNVLKSGDRNKYGTKPGILLSNSDARTALGVAIKNTEADIIGFNEIDGDMYSTSCTYSIQNIGTAAGLSSDPTNGYDWKFFSTTSTAYHYANGFAYNKSVLEHISSTRVWLSPTGNTYGTSRYSTDDPDRTCVYAKFKHKPSQKQFWVLVTQLPTAKQTGNTSMSAGVNKLAQDKCGSLPQILIGDMNSVDVSSHDNQAGAQKLKEYWTDAYEYIEANIPVKTLEDWYYYKYPGTLSGTGSANDSSSNYQYDILTYTKRKFPERRIDHIMTHGACTVTSYRTVRNTYVFDPDPNVNDDEVSYAPSDHLPVVCYITLD